MLKKYGLLILLSFWVIDAFSYRLKDEDVEVEANGIITMCSYNIVTGGNIIEIPEVLDGITITGIGDYVFRPENGKITGLKLPSTLQSIGNGAFQGHALTDVDIPAGVTSIGSRAFAYNALASIKLPDGLTFMGDGAFESNLLGSVSIPAGITDIGHGTFRDNQITDVTFAEGLLSIGSDAFINNQIANLILPNSLLSIGGWAFYNNNIENVNLPSVLQTIGWQAFTNNSITTLTIPNSVVSIGSEAFSNNEISSLNFQANSKLTQISQGCFQSNELQNVVLPNTIIQIDEYAFIDNRNLVSVDFGTSLVRIKRDAFHNCNLSSLNLPESLVFIGRYAFYGNSLLSSFNLPVSANKYVWNDSNDNQHNEGANVGDFISSYVARIEYTFKPEDLELDANGIITNCYYFNDITNLGSVITIPAQIDGKEIKGIANNAFNNSGISELIISEGIETISEWAFQTNELVSVTIPNTVTRIEHGAFYDNCISTLIFQATSTLEFIGNDAFGYNRLKGVAIPASVSKIGKYAFAGNYLENVSIEPNSNLVSIGSQAFAWNYNLASITLPDPKHTGYADHWLDWDNNQYSNTNRTITSFESFYKIPIEHTLTTPQDSIEVIDGVITYYAPGNPFANIITIPDTIHGQRIIGIGNDVFANMDLIGVNLPSSLETIGRWAFGDNELLELFIPANVREIDDSAFGWNNINEVVFETNSSLRHIGRSSFSGNQISTLILPDSVNYIGGDAFNSNQISTLSLPDSLNFVGHYAFAWNQIPDELIIPDSLKTIQEGAFMGNQITSLIFGQNSILEYLGEYAFANNQISNEVVIPQSLTEIGAFAFQYNQIFRFHTHENIIEYGYRAFYENDPGLEFILHKPPTIPYVTHFFWWKDNFGNRYDPGQIISSSGGSGLDLDNRYKAVVDQFFVVKFVVTDDNGLPLQNANINFSSQYFDETLITDVNGIDSIGPVLRGLWDVAVGGITGCRDYTGTIDVQDDMTVEIVLTRYYNVNMNVSNALNNNPIEGAPIVVENETTNTDIDGNAKLSLSDGDYATAINVLGYKAHSDSIHIQDADTTIFVKLAPVEINYFANDGTSGSHSHVSDGAAYSIDANSYNRNAYTFLHWNTNSDDSGTSYSENELITLANEDIDLYAIWEPVQYTITYHLDGGTNDATNPGTYTVEDDINFLPATKPTLYFASWKDVDGNRVSKIDVGSTGDIELWAIFTPEPTYYIDYHNLDNASHNNLAVYTQFDLPLSFSDAFKRGYAFDGWFEDNGLTQQISSVPTGSKVDLNVYAKWGNAIEYTIAYELGGGTNHLANPISYTIESADIVFSDPSKIGGKFVGWYSDSGFTTQVVDIPSGNVGDTTLHAKWDLDTFDIQYVVNGGTNTPTNPILYTIDTDDILFEIPSKLGAKFMGWYDDASFTNEVTVLPKGSYGDTIIYASWQLDTFAIQYELYGGQNHSANPAEYTIQSPNIQFGTPTKIGANFLGWFSDNAYSNKITALAAGSIGDTTIYAQWDLDNYDISYVLNGGQNHSANPPIYHIDSDTIRFEDPTKLGASFLGWYSDSGFGASISEIPRGSVGDTAIYAQWELDSYAIQYELDGGENHVDNPVTYTIESANIQFAMPTKLGAKFMGWYDDASFANAVPEITTGSYGDTTVFARWELDTFSIQYELDGGTNHALNPSDYTIESALIVFEAPDKPGFHFDGWFTDLTYSQIINGIPEGSVGDITLYAKWREIFTVQFVITTDGKNPAKDVDVILDNTSVMRSDELGLADTLMPDKSQVNYSVEIDGIVIDQGTEVVAGADLIIEIEIVDCYMRWYDVIFCDNGKGLWTNFVWFKEGNEVSMEQFFHNPGGIEDGYYRLMVTSVNGETYIWEKEYITDIFAVNVYPNPVIKSGHLNFDIKGKADLSAAVIYIYNVSGALIKTINNPQFENVIRIDDVFAPGLYHIVLVEKNKNKKTVKEFIVR